MKKLLVVFLMFGLIFGTAAITKAADFGIHFGRDRGYRSYSYNDRFNSWEASQRDRINDAYRDNMITQYEYDKLNGELSRVEAYYDRISEKGWVSGSDRDRLERMEARVSSDVDREIHEHMD